MAAVTQTIPNFLGGVSKQTDIKKQPGQVRECLNALPDPTFGLMKRPGFKYIKSIYSRYASGNYQKDLKDGKWFFIKRDDVETYIGVILDKAHDAHGTEPIRIWNKDGTKCTVTFETSPADSKLYLDTTRDNYDILTVQDTSIVTNKTKVVTSLAAPTDYISNYKGTVRIKTVAYSIDYELSLKVGGNTYSTNYVTLNAEALPGANSATNPSTEKFNTAERILKELKGGVSGGVIATLKDDGVANSSRTAGTYALSGSALSSSGSGTGAAITITVDSDGKPTYAVVAGGTQFMANETFDITDSQVGGGGAPDFKITVATASDHFNTGLENITIPGHALTTTRLDSSLELELRTNNGTGYSGATDLATTGGSGSGLKVDITGVNSGVVTSVAIHGGDVSDHGIDYKVGDVAIITQGGSGGNCGVKVTSVTNTGQVLAIQLDQPIAFELTTTDSQGGIHLDGFNEQVRTQADLPAESLQGRVVKIVALGGESDTFWLKFFANNGVSGKGSWEETKDPTVSEGLNATTLPHELFSSGLNTFVFRQPKESDQTTLAWKGRAVGDLLTNSDPSFVGETIQQAFYHNNRLGFLTKDNVSMSKVNSFFDFYYSSALTATDADPIDINCSSIRPAVLHAVIPTAQGLILFSKNQQFIMFSDAEILTPSSAVIRGISNYEMDATIDPVDVGTVLNFVSKTPSYTRIFGMQTRGSEESPMVMDIGKVVSEWVPDTVNSLLSSPQNSLIALYGDNRLGDAYVGDSKMYMYKTYSVGDKVLMQAWFNWDLPGNVQHASIDSDTMWVVIESGSRYYLISASLTQTPEETIMTTADGQQVNPHMDLYAKAHNGLKGNILSFSAAGTYTNGNRVPGVYTVTHTGTSQSGGTGAVFTATVASDHTVTFAMNLTTGGGEGYNSGDTFTLPDSQFGNGGDYGVGMTVLTCADIKKVVYDETNNLSKCYVPWNQHFTTRNPVILIAGNDSPDFAGVTEYGFTVQPETIDQDLHGKYYIVNNKDLSDQADNVYVGYQYNYDVELPKTYYRLSQEGARYDYTAPPTIARMRFALGLSSVCSFKIKSKGYRGELAEFTIDDAKAGTSGKGYIVPFLLKEENGIRITLDGAKQDSNTYSIARTTVTDEDGVSQTVNSSDTVTFTTAPLGHTVKQLYGGTGYTAATGVATTSSGNGTGLTVNTTVSSGVITAVTVNNQGTGYKPDEVITITGGTISATFLIKALPQTIQITTDTWYDVQASSDAGQYLSDDVPLVEENVFTVPIHQRSDNFNLRVFSNSPFPVSLTSMMWEGQYSPRFYRRT